MRHEAIAAFGDRRPAGLVNHFLGRPAWTIAAIDLRPSTRLLGNSPLCELACRLWGGPKASNKNTRGPAARRQPRRAGAKGGVWRPQEAAGRVKPKTQNAHKALSVGSSAHKTKWPALVLNMSPNTPPLQSPTTGASPRWETRSSRRSATKRSVKSSAQMAERIAPTPICSTPKSCMPRALATPLPRWPLQHGARPNFKTRAARADVRMQTRDAHLLCLFMRLHVDGFGPRADWLHLKHAPLSLHRLQAARALSACGPRHHR